MKWLIPGLVVASMAAFLCADDNKPTKLEPKNGNCEITFPAKPMEKSDSKGGQIIMEALEGKAALMLQFNVMPDAVATDSDEAVKKIFDGGQTALGTSLKGKLLKADDGKFNGYPSRDIDMEVQGLGIYRVKLILTSGRFYQVTAAGPKEYVNGDEVKAFMDSFKLKD